MKLKNRIIAIILVLTNLFAVMPLAAFASVVGEEEDAMEDINKSEIIKDFKIDSEPQLVADDGYIGIPVEITVFYNGDKPATPGYNGTPIIMYLVNTKAERVGRTTDDVIIKSMLDRGYAVAVVDYKNNAKAVPGELEFSATELRLRLRTGEFFTDKTLFPAGEYMENHVVPAGHNISPREVYYEIDKHGTDGAIERIVEVWNYDFRATSSYAEMIIKWTDSSGNRKSVQNGFDATTPVWYTDATGSVVDNENGEYIKIKHTWAKTITDCTKKDGSPLDFDLSLLVIYPDDPATTVPVMVLGSSRYFLADSHQSMDRAQLLHYAFTGYAVSSYETELVPMCRFDHYGYFDGGSGVTGINGTFTLSTFSRNNNTAAMRYLRALALNPETKDTYKFDVDAFGIYGNSKGAFHTYLGSETLLNTETFDPQSETLEQFCERVDKKVSSIMTEKFFVIQKPDVQNTTLAAPTTVNKDNYMYFDGDTRYQNGCTAIVDGDYVVDAGELQPNLVYTDENGTVREISSAVQWVYSACGGTTMHKWTENHAPIFISISTEDPYNSGFEAINYMVSLARTYDVPSLHLEVPIGHAFTYGEDRNYGVDTYMAMIKSAGYYLKNDPVSVVYTTPANGDASVRINDGITIKFYGPVSLSEIKKVTVISENGTVATGSWSASYGNTEWVFTPDNLDGGAKYTVTVPATLKGSNGKEMGKAYSYSFYTYGESVISDAGVQSVITVNNSNGTYFTFTAPSLSEFDGNQIKLRFKVTNTASNTAQIYKVSSTSDTGGELVAEIQLSGAGYYECDVTDYVMSAPGEQVYFLIKNAKATENSVHYFNDLAVRTNLDFMSNGGWTFVTNKTVGGETVANALEAKVYPKYGQHGISDGYASGNRVLYVSDIIKSGKAVTKEDYGRSFTVTLRYCDTTSRYMQLWWNTCSSSATRTCDYGHERASTRTTANVWETISVNYNVYEMDYGVEEIVKNLRVMLFSDGGKESPIYFDSITVTENVTDTEIGAAALVCVNYGDNKYSAPSSSDAFEYSGNTYGNLKDVLEAANGNENTLITLLRNYRAEEQAVISTVKNLVINLNGHTIETADASFLGFNASNSQSVTVTVKNGTILVGGKPIISHVGASSGVSARDYEIAFENVYISTVPNTFATFVISDDKSPNNVKITQTVKFTDCTLDVLRSDMPKTAVVVLPNGKNGLSSSYIFYGGSIRLTSFVRLNISENMGKVTFLANSGGKITSLVTANSAPVSASLSVKTEDKYSLFSIDGEALKINGYDTYKVTSTENSTKYGVIPDEYSASEYPFAVFADGKFLAAYTMLSTTSENIAALSAPAQYMNNTFDKNVQILMRRNYAMSGDKSFDNLSRIDGTVTIDLGGYTLTLKSGVPLVNMYAKPGTPVGTNSTAVFDTNINVLNGKVITGSAYLVKVQSKPCNTDAQRAQYNKQKLTNVLFDGITITASSQLISSDGAVNLEKGAKTNVTFNNCEIDISGVPASTVLFGGKDSADMNDLEVKFVGGNITASDGVNGLAFSALDTGDTVYFEGASTTLTVPNGTLPTWLVRDDEATLMEFSSATVGATSTVYTLAKSTSMQTPYGLVPSSAIEAGYEWLIFSEGSFIKGVEGTNCYTNALDFVKINYPTATVQMLLMKDGTTIGSQYANLAAFTGNLTIDLNTYTITCNRALLMVFAKASAKTTTITVTNGTLKTGATADFSNVVKLEAGTIANKVYNFTFDNVKFVIPSGAQSIVATREGSNTNAQTVNITFNDCDFDIQTPSTLTVFEASDTNGVNNLNLIFNGGSITAAGLENTTLWTLDANDSIEFNKSESTNAYIQITLDYGKMAPAVAFPTDMGNMYLAGYSVGATGTTLKTRTYRLGNQMLNGTYIPKEYEDTNAYPFAVLADGELYGCYNYFGDNTSDVVSAIEMAYNLLYNSKSPTIVLRRNYSTSTASGIDNYYNFGGVSTGTLTFDLGDFSFTTQKANAPFYLEAKTQAKKGTVTINIQNGTFIVKNAPIIQIQSSANCTTNNVFDITLTEVKVIYASASGNLNGVVAYAKGVNAAKIKTSITLDNCIIDFNTNAPSNNVTVFALNDTTGHKVDVTVKGGKILADSFEKITLYALSSASEDSFTFVKNKGGEYTKLYLINSSEVSEIFATDIGERVFKPDATDGAYTVFSLEIASIMVGDKSYGSIVDAINESKEGDVITLFGDIEAVELTVTNGVKLDLNGKCIKVQSMVVFNGSKIVDSVGGGFVEVPRDRLLITTTTSDSIAVYIDGDDSGRTGYKFVGVTDQNTFNQTENGFELVFRPSLNNNTTLNKSIFEDGAENNALNFIIRLANEDGKVIREFVYTDSLIAEAYQSDRALKITVRNIPEEYTLLNVSYVLVSETGMECSIQAGAFER